MRPTNEPCEFTEDDFIAAVERELQKHTHSQYLSISRISQSKERHLGYDGVIDHVLPIYIQFKRSHFYRDSFTGKLAKDRKLKLGYERFFLSFGLHKDRHSGCFEQHNALFKLSKKFPACYVAPLFHRVSQLKAYKTNKSHNLSYPWRFSYVHIHEGLTSYIDRIRMFDNCISIKPHKSISSAEPTHHYTFDKNRQVFFHSTPELIEPPGDTFLQFILQSLEQFTNINDQDLTRDAFNTALELLGDRGSEVMFQYVSSHIELSEATMTMNEKLFHELPNIVQLKILENFFWYEFGIKQLVIHGEVT